MRNLVRRPQLPSSSLRLRFCAVSSHSLEAAPSSSSSGTAYRGERRWPRIGRGDGPPLSSRRGRVCTSVPPLQNEKHSSSGDGSRLCGNRASCRDRVQHHPLCCGSTRLDALLLIDDRGPCAVAGRKVRACMDVCSTLRWVMAHDASSCRCAAASTEPVTARRAETGKVVRRELGFAAPDAGTSRSRVRPSCARCYSVNSCWRSIAATRQHPLRPTRPELVRSPPAA